MKNYHFKLSSALLIFLISIGLVSNSFAQKLNSVVKTGEAKIAEGRTSQQQIDKIVESSQERLINYRALIKQIEGLNSYKEQLQTQVQSQQNLLVRFDESIRQVSHIERQMLPLISKMVDSLEQFVLLDIPFNLVERKERILFIKNNLTRADVDISEKFRQVMEAYQIENEYGRKIDSYGEIIELDDQQYDVDVLRIGRLVLVAQSKDTKISLVWNNDQKQWQVLDVGIYRNSIRHGIKMANKQASVDVLTLPIHMPRRIVQ